MQITTNLLKTVCLNLLLLASGIWLVYEVGRLLVSQFEHRQIAYRAETVMLPLATRESWPLTESFFTEKERTVVLALSADCGVCINDIPFYQRLISEANKSSSSYGVVLFLDNRVDNSALRKRIGDGTYNLFELDLSTTGIKEVPVIWVLDRSRQISMIHIGKLSTIKEGNLLGLARGRFTSFPESQSTPVERALSTPSMFELTEESFDEIKKSIPTVVLDVRPRALFQLTHRPGSINIPLDEVTARTPDELDLAVPTVIDCTYTDPRYCDAAAFLLGEQGFYKAHILNRGTTPMASCSLAAAKPN